MMSNENQVNLSPEFEVNDETVNTMFPDNELLFIAKIQTKKSNLRKLIVEKGKLLKDAINSFDNYQYFSEAQYKEVLNPLLVECKLELTSGEKEIVEFDGTDKQPFGRRVSMFFALKDTETGYEEVTVHSGEAIDRTDKALYKAKTGAIKYFIASTFLIATFDDPEKEDEKPAPKKTYTKAITAPPAKAGTISKVQKDRIVELFKDSKKELQDIMKKYDKKKITELDLKEASEIIKGKESEKVNE